MARLFGTDGVRGLANKDITAELALDLSVAVAHELGGHSAFGGHRATAVVGRDPRASGEFLAMSVMAGLASAGVDVLDAGVLPTPAIAYLTQRMNAEMGAMLSASHNAMPDNGLKFFARGGHKLADDLEDRISERLGVEWERPTGAGVGRIRPFPSGAEFYIEHLLRAVPGRLDGLRIVIDAAHGAASVVGAEVFRRAGATVDVIGGEPDGLNINDGYGSTHLEQLEAAVRLRGADMGVAFDGDADRCLAVDADGNRVDGDQIMAILALSLHERGKLVDDTLVATVMSNLGLIQAMEREGIRVVQTAVGDRYVLEEMRARGYTLGGEQSGHVIMLDHGTTGDGVLTALALAQRVVSSGTPLSVLAGVMTRLPQVLVNVKGVDKDRVETDEGVRGDVAAVEAELGSQGRVLLRKSGTEPLVRVMVEADTEERAQAYAERLAGVVQERLAL
ncbi:phosphoglucosamine mutase [Ornithinimicrobium tianjinense]|uniref:Phosphoglucosamine mutase n=1 Tax=Ornithinimicrobium tianjinense TaxID=1195761 RepID=A0A917BWD9_9MICO|nr:phosphoglucosamine mutase [Ornithinimicrobium tianjinense]GGF59219.1 phosphoglucosamine mutase [Ornithinimicrobium tianjinense]